MTELQNNLPPGWDCRYDAISGRFYYINHYMKTTTWDDPRNRHKQFHGLPSHSKHSGESIQLQHGSPELRRNYVYPSKTSPIPAFQMPAHMSPKSVPLQDMKPKMSPLSVKSAKTQDTTLTTSDPEDSVAKISALFPTVSETHIKLLLKKYHNREALVISVLQVEKYPITTPGPFATPPPQRNIHQPLHATPPPGMRGCHSRGGSPGYRPGFSTGNNVYTNSPKIGEHFRNSPRPQSSPKLKLSCRYMKSVFPQADETIILEVLQNNENNIQKTSETLKTMGFEKKDTVKVAQQKLEAKLEQKKEEEKIEAEKQLPAPQIRLKTAEEKKRMKTDLQEKYKDVAEHLICIALESVDFDKDKASQILQNMLKEDSENGSNGSNKNTADSTDVPSTSAGISANISLPISQSRQSLKSLMKVEKDLEKVTFSRVIEECENEYRSPHISNTKGPHPDSAKGANEKLLLEDYVKWQGSNSSLRKGPQGLAKGHNADLLLSRTYRACGANKDLSKGPKFGLAKGSIFSQLRMAVVGDGRGK